MTDALYSGLVKAVLEYEYGMAKKAGIPCFAPKDIEEVLSLEEAETPSFTYQKPLDPAKVHETYLARLLARTQAELQTVKKGLPQAMESTSTPISKRLDIYKRKREPSPEESIEHDDLLEENYIAAAFETSKKVKRASSAEKAKTDAERKQEEKEEKAKKAAIAAKKAQEDKKKAEQKKEAEKKRAEERKKKEAGKKKPKQQKEKKKQKPTKKKEAAKKPAATRTTRGMKQIEPKETTTQTKRGKTLPETIDIPDEEEVATEEALEGMRRIELAHNFPLIQKDDWAEQLMNCLPGKLIISNQWPDALMESDNEDNDNPVPREVGCCACDARDLSNLNHSITNTNTFHLQICISHVLHVKSW